MKKPPKSELPHMSWGVRWRGENNDVSYHLYVDFTDEADAAYGVSTPRRVADVMKQYPGAKHAWVLAIYWCSDSGSKGLRAGLATSAEEAIGMVERTIQDLILTAQPGGVR